MGSRGLWDEGMEGGVRKQNGVAKIRMYQSYTAPPPLYATGYWPYLQKILQNTAHFFELNRFLENRTTIRSVSKGFHLKFLGKDNAIY